MHFTVLSLVYFALSIQLYIFNSLFFRTSVTRKTLFSYINQVVRDETEILKLVEQY